MEYLLAEIAFGVSAVLSVIQKAYALALMAVGLFLVFLTPALHAFK